MNKLFTKIVALALGAAMVVGVGVSVGSKSVGKAEAATGSFNLSCKFTTKKDGTGTVSSTDGSTEINSSTKFLSTDGSVTANISKVTYYYFFAGNASLISSSSITASKLYPGKNNTYKFASKSAQGTLSFSLSSTDLHVTSVEITGFSSKSGATITVDEATAATKTQTVTSTSDTYTFAYSGTDTRSVSISVPNDKATNVSLIKVNYASGDTPTPTTYTVDYDANGGTGTMTDENSPYSSGATVTVLANEFTRANYDFDHWNTAADDSGTDYDADETFSITANTTLYAQWVEQGGGGGSDTYSLVNETSGLVNGAKIILVTNSTTTSVSKRYAMTRTITNSLNGFAEVTVSNNSVAKDSTTDSYAYTLQENGNYWDLLNESNDKYLVSVTNKKMKEVDSPSVHWDISISNGIATIASTAGADSIGKIMFNWNNGSARYTTYTSSASVSMILPSIFQYGSDDKETIELSAENMTSFTAGDADRTPVVKNAATDAPISGCKFTSSDEKVAKVTQDGKIHAVAQGTATITVQKSSDDQYKYTSTTFTVTVTGYTVEGIYQLDDDDTVEFDAYYAGAYANGVIVMDGVYGVILYGNTPETTWNVDTTVLHISGTKATYKNLIEIKNANVSIQTDQSKINRVKTPINYTITGSESTEDLTVANRRTFFTGKVTAISSTSSGYNITIGGKGFYLYNNDASKIVTGETTIYSYLDSKKGTDDEVTVKGFTSFYTNFQICIYEIVLVDDSFTVEQFSQMILDETDGICKNDNTTNLTALTLKWNKLGGSEGWQKLKATEQAKFQSHDIVPNYDGTKLDEHTVLENAVGRYNVICKRYFSTDNFADRYDVDTAPVVPSQSYVNLIDNLVGGNATVPVIIVSIIGVSALGGFFFLRKRKEI